MQVIYCVDDIEKLHKGHWFRKENMRFFKSRVLQDVYHGMGLVFFVSSERNGEAARLYTVRVYDSVTGDIKTHGEFQGYKTAYLAKRAALIAGDDHAASVLNSVGILSKD